jgi:hypothetical protein
MRVLEFFCCFVVAAFLVACVAGLAWVSVAAP